MRKNIRISEILTRYRRHRAWQKAVQAMACVVVFCTTYALILPAITLEKKPVCGLDEHTHTEDCYTQITSVEKREPACTLESDGCLVVHRHDDRCYDENGQMWCTLPELAAHTHTDSCYTVPETHTHGEGCYQKEQGELVCTVPEGEISHTHTKEAGCYEEDRTLTCALEESEDHAHSEACYTAVEKLTCTLSDQPHQHTDECYAWNEVLTCTRSTEPGAPVLSCGKEELELHEHTDSCYEAGSTEPVCGKPRVIEHAHTDGCFKTVEEPVDTESRTCGIEEGAGAHAHTEKCYDAEKNLICGSGHKHTKLCYGTWILTCGKEEHTHTEACMVEVESEEDWKKTLPDTLKNDWREDLLAVAESQLDYAEARPDFQLGEEPRRWSRYGEWYGQPDGEWNSLFVLFCLHYAEIPEESLPQDSDIAAWVEKLAGRAEGFEEYQLYYSAEDYTPQPGDLVFLGLDEDETADRVGIVTNVGSGLARSSEEDTASPSNGTTPGSAEEQASLLPTDAEPDAPAVLETIEGDVSGKVVRCRYPMEGVRILGYAQLPEQPVEAPAEPILICTKQEHIHTELCDSLSPDGKGLVITCGLEEHTHGESCYAAELYCGMEAHTHTEQCGTPDPEGNGIVLTCGKEEHTHTETCRVPQPQEYIYEDDTVLVTVTLPAGSRVPKDATLRVTPITREEDRYSLLERQAQEAVEGEPDQLVLYDVSFYTPTGDYLPVEESAAVTVAFKQALLSGDRVEVIHYGEDAAPAALEDVEIQRDENDALSGLRFQTNGFSVFGVMTTRAAETWPVSQITLYPGQIFEEEEVYTSEVEQSEEGVVEAAIQPYENILKTGSGDDDYTYPGARQPVGNAEYTFTQSGDNYTARHGDNLYLNLSNAQSGCFSGTAAEAFSILDQASPLIPGKDVQPIPAGRFALSAGGPSENTHDYRSLFFHSTTENAKTRLGFEARNEQYNKWGCNLVLFKKAEAGETASAEIPGFVQVTEKNQIVSGKQYLIAGKARGDVDGEYYVLYPNASAANRYQHTAKVSPYRLTMTARQNGTTMVTVGKKTWNVTVTDQIRVETEKAISIPLPAGAEVSVADETKAAVTIENGLVTLTGVAVGKTTAAVTVNGTTYTWKIEVIPHTTFRLTYQNGKMDPVITFHLRSKKTGEALPADTVRDYTGAPNTQYRLVEERGAQPPEDDSHKNIGIPYVEGYRFSEALYHFARENTDHRITGFATTGYQDEQVQAGEHAFLFYDEANPSAAHSLGDDVSAVDVYLEYDVLPLTNTVSPSGTTINLFDYWVTGKEEGQVYGNKPSEGINKDHALHFTTGGDSMILNQWTGDKAGVRQGLVANRLGSDGYPCLAGNTSASGSGSTESLAYLFDPDYSGPSAQYREVFENVSGLLQVSDDGYYYYNSTLNFAELDRNSNRFNIYPDWAVKHEQSKTYGQFFPLDDYSTVDRNTEVTPYNQSGDLNHFFGVTISSRFIQRNGGHTGVNNEVPMTFEFTGDDDVWIFIDGVLVADLGGIHDAADVEINFATGKVTISKIVGKSGSNIETTFSNIFAGTDVKLEGGIFPDDTYHTLKFYYMERGGVASNLQLKFNLVTYPTSGITKVDQMGDPIRGAEFKLFRTGETYSLEGAQVICSGTTDGSGEFIFLDPDGNPINLGQLYKRFGPYYVLQETKIPTGYRDTGVPIHLEIRESDGSDTDQVRSYVMICTNTRDSGAYAAPSLQVTAAHTLKVGLGENARDVTLGEDEGTLFAVVMKYVGPDGAGKTEQALGSDANWSPVYGSAAEGYTVLDRSKYPNVIDAVRAAKDQYPKNQNIFYRSSNGSFQALIEDLPGNIATYNFMAGTSDPQSVQYAVSYYWEDGSGTHRVQDYTISTDGSYSFSRVFGTDIQVPNMNNRIAVQKLDEDKVTPVNGAVFGMYPVDEIDGTQYYVAEDQTKLFLAPDTDRDYVGEAWVQGAPDTKGTYTVDHEGEGLGTVTAAIGGASYTVRPIQTKETGSVNNYREAGIAEFEKIPTGKYIVRELTAPKGYSVNFSHVMILVTDNAIYANAGTETDGIAVSRGPGYLAGNLHYYATIGDIDNTLSWIYTQLKVSDVSTKFADVDPTGYAGWKWVQTKREDAYTPNAQPPGEWDTALTAYLKYSASEASGGGSESVAQFSYAVDEDLYQPAEDPKRKPTMSDNVGAYRRLYTKTGWSYLEILQDYSYGSTAKRPNADYADWSTDQNGSPFDLSKLFSRSIYVHVTDPRGSDLEITKLLGPHKQAGDEALDFTFTVRLTQGGIPLTGSYSYQLYQINDARELGDPVGDPKTLMLTNGVGTVTLKDHQAVVIRDIPADVRYTVVETDPRATDTATEWTIQAEQKVWNAQTNAPGTVSYTSGTVSGGMYWRQTGDGVDNLTKVDYTNDRVPTQTVTVRKVDTANHNKTLPGAQFTLTRVRKGPDGDPVSGEDGQPKLEYHNGTVWVETETALTTDGEGRIQFDNVGPGAYTLTEVKAPEGYSVLKDTVVITIDAHGRIDIGTPESGAPLGYTVENDEVTLTVPNSSGKKLPASGGAGTALLYILGGMLMAGTGLLLAARKRMSAGR